MIWMNQNIGTKDTTEYSKVSKTTDWDTFLFPRVKSDLNIRRLRIKDLFVVASDKLIDEMGHYTHLDTIFFTNLTVFGIVHGYDTLRDMRSLGIFNTLEHFLEVASDISTYMKRIPNCNDDTKQRLCELTCLCGYLQNDMPGWDTKEELIGLAEGGNRHGLICENWDEVFNEVVDEIMSPVPMPAFITFADYITEGKWLTSGSSSIGKVEWSFGEEQGKFKARKNMLNELYTADEIISLVENWNGELVSRAFTKDELGKRRLAVASNIEAYLSESYILHLFGHGFKNWDYITLDESPKQQHERNCSVILALRNNAFALPFDFRRFDHQPTTREVQTIIGKIASRIHVPLFYKSHFSKFTHKMLNSYAKSRIEMQIGSEKIVQEVTGGIPSGVRTTSLVGNSWNLIMTKRAKKIVHSLLGYDPISLIGIKGDDTYILSKYPLALYLFRLAYASINAIGIDSKFGISQNICEFLRNEISTEGVRGWSNRSIPSTTQRKPWNPQPWSSSSEVSTLTNNIYLLERRMKRKIEKLHLASKIKWSKFTNQSYHWLHLPTRLGGFGLYKYDGWEPNCKLPLVTKPNILINNLISPKSLPWIELQHHTLLEYQSETMRMKIAADDIMGPQKLFSREFINKLRDLKVEWKQSYMPLVIKRAYVTCPDIATHVYWPKFKSDFIEPKDKTWPEFTTWLREYQNVKRASSRTREIIPSMVDLMQEQFPGVLAAMRLYEQRG